jgi:hypothetical protein
MVTESSTEDKPKTPTPSTSTVHGLSIAALVVGVVAFLSGLVPVWGLLVGIAAIVLGTIALKKSKTPKDLALQLSCWEL